MLLTYMAWLMTDDGPRLWWRDSRLCGGARLANVSVTMSDELTLREGA